MEDTTIDHYQKQRQDSSKNLNSLIKLYEDEKDIKAKLVYLKKLRNLTINREIYFSFFENIILTEKSSVVRYHVVKLLLEFFPQKGLALIEWVLTHDSNYRFPISNFSMNSKHRHNFNDIVNYSAEKYHIRKDAVKSIIAGELLPVALSWKDFKSTFSIYYDLSLNSFLFYHQKKKVLLYVVEKYRDPFAQISRVDRIKFQDYQFGNMDIEIFIPFITKVVKTKEVGLNVDTLQNSSVGGLPKLRIYSVFKSIVVYIDY